MECVLVGSTKIASIHLKELLKIKFKKIYLVSRRQETSKYFLKKYNFKDKRIIISSRNILKKKIDCLYICSSTNYHHVYLNYLKKSKFLIIMEKPIISINIFKKKMKYELNKIYKNHKKIIVSNPMTFFAKSFLKIFKAKLNKDINNIEIYYFAKGTKVYNQIPEDLLSHIINFIDEILNFKKITIKTIEKKFVKKNKNSWFYSGYINNKIKIKISLKENLNIKKSNFFFKINDEKYFRKTKTHKNEFLNFISFKNKKFYIKNPMVEFLNTSLKNRNNLSYIKKNKLLTQKLMLKKQLLMNI